MKSTLARIALGATVASLVAFAVETRTWMQSQASEFERGTLDGLALSSSGRLTLAPTFQEVHDASLPQLWCAAAGPSGTLYAAGADGKVIALDARGQARVLATLEGGSVYALAVNSKGDVFAATSPDARIYRIAPDGKATLFSEPKARYIWALVFDAAGALHAASGDPGQILKIDADGKASVLFDAEEAHIRSLILDNRGGFVAGTEPSGLVIRVSARGEGFVLHQTAKREVIALLAAKDGTIYAAASGVRGTARPALTPPATITPQPVPTATASATQPQGQPGNAAQQNRTTTPVAPPIAPVLTGPTGGSEIYRIGPDGEPARVWSDARVLVYALAFDAAGKPVAGTGNDGRIYRIDSNVESTLLATAEPMQVTALVTSPSGAIHAVTANAGKIYRLGPETRKEGTIESELFDAGSFTYWGRLRIESDLRGGTVMMESRSGNLDRAQKNWSPWSAVDAAKGSRIQAPAARFLGWRATLKAAPTGASPVLSLVEAAYQAKNVAPVVEQIEVEPANYKFPSSTLSSSSSTTLSLGAIGQPQRSGPSTPNVEPAGPVTLTYDKGQMAARWRASDANGDTLRYKVEIRGERDREWMLLKDEVAENRISFDSIRYADGRYLLRITANDAVDNYPGQALTAQAESDGFVIDNTAPVVDSLAVTREGGKVRLRFKASDVGTPLLSALYSVSGGEWLYVPPTTGITDSLLHDYEIVFDSPGQGETVIAVKVSDENDNVTVHKTVLRP